MSKADREVIKWQPFTMNLDHNIESLAVVLTLSRIHSVYLSHHPDQEMIARIFAEKLSRQGIEVIIAADVRPEVPYALATEEDKAKVRSMIATTDLLIVLEA